MAKSGGLSNIRSSRGQKKEPPSCVAEATVRLTSTDVGHKKRTGATRPCQYSPMPLGIYRLTPNTSRDCPSVLAIDAATPPIFPNRGRLSDGISPTMAPLKRTECPTVVRKLQALLRCDDAARLETLQIINYKASADGKWCLLNGIAGGADGITGQLQLYSVERNVSQPVPAHAGSFATIPADQADVFAFADKAGAGGSVCASSRSYASSADPSIR